MLTCSCIQGYIDFETYEYYRQHGVEYYWGFGAGLSCIVLTIGLTFVVVEYCTQSHLNTEDYDTAMRGLRVTRWFKKYTYYFRGVPNFLIEAAKRLGHMMLRRRVRAARRSLVWTAATTAATTHMRVPRVVVMRPSLQGGEVEEEAQQDYIPLQEWESEGRRGSDAASDYSDHVPLRKLQFAQVNTGY